MPKYTLFEKRYSKTGEVLESSAKLLSELFSECWHEGAKEDAPIIAPYDSGGLRGDANVKYVYWLVLDCDHLTVEQLIAVLRALEGLEYIIHTTASNGTPPDAAKGQAGDQCGRLWIPLAHPIAARQWRGARAAWLTKENLTQFIDRTTKNEERIYFWPTKGKGENVCAHVAGAALDLAPYCGAATEQSPPPRAEVTKPTGAIDIEAMRGALQKTTLGREALSVKQIRTPGRRSKLLTLTQGAAAACALGGIECDAEALEFLLSPLVAAVVVYADDEHEEKRFAEYWADQLSQMCDSASAKANASLAERQEKAAVEKRITDRVAARLAEQQSVEDSEAPSILGEDGKYTQEALEQWAREAGCTVEEFRRRWIISKNRAHYFFVAGRYQPAVSEDDAEIRARDVLQSAPVKLEDESEKNGVTVSRPRTMKTLRRAYGTSPLHIRGSLCAKASYYDAKEDTFVEALAPLRGVRAVCHPEIERWLELLCDPTDLGSLLDWIATVWDVSRATSALYLAGPSGCGKSLLAQGLARLWSGAPTPMENFVSDFNSDVASCPLVFADEELPQEVSNITAIIRRMLGQSSFELRRKYLPNVMVEGCPRLMIASNDDRLFEKVKGQDLNSASVEAVAERILVINASARAKEFLNTLPNEVKRRWIEGEIAEHAMWLKETRQVDTSGRFLVPGKMAAMHRSMSISNYSGAVLQFIARAMEKGIPSEDIRAGAGELLVKPALFVKTSWERNVDETFRYSQQRVAEALREHLSLDRGVVRPEKGGPRWYRVKPDLLYLWVERNGIGDLEMIREKIETPKA